MSLDAAHFAGNEKGGSNDVYEEITERPPFLLSCFLPVPIRTDGCKYEVGGEVKCQYVARTLAQASDSDSSETQLCVRRDRATSCMVASNCLEASTRCAGFPIMQVIDWRKEFQNRLVD
jgi:hypothetical protein